MNLLLGPVEPAAEDNEALVDLRKDLAASLAWTFQALLAASAFCAVTAASHGDWNLLTGGETELPLISVKLAFLPFLLIGPLALLAMQIYLQIQTHALLLMPRANENSLIRNHDKLWPFSLLGIASYAVVPLVTLCMLWKVWPRRFSDDPVPFGLIPFHVGSAAVGAVLAISCMASVRAALSDHRYLKRLSSHVTGARYGWLTRGFVTLVFLVMSGCIGSAFLDRHMELRKARLEGADLRYFDLSGADLREARLKGALMGGAMLPNAQLAGANLDGADLRGVQLTDADLSQSRLNHADLTGAVLIGANLRRVEVEGANFDYAWMIGTTFEPLPATQADRTKQPTSAEIAYAQANIVQKLTFNHAEMCAATITPGHWKDRAVQVGDIDPNGGQPYYDDRAAGAVPDQLHAAPLSKSTANAPDGGSQFLAEAVEQCFVKLRVCARDPYPARCDRKSGEE